MGCDKLAAIIIVVLILIAFIQQLFVSQTVLGTLFSIFVIFGSVSALKIINGQ